MGKQWRIRVRGVPRKDIDAHLLAQALVMIGEDLREQHGAEPPTPLSPETTTPEAEAGS